jgi:hypothetical protein
MTFVLPWASEPSAITGLPNPHRAVQAVGIPASPFSMVNPSFGECRSGTSALELLKRQLAKAEDSGKRRGSRLDVGPVSDSWLAEQRGRKED